MSKPTIITTECPYCNEKINVPYYQDVNVSNHPELKAAILSKNFFQYTCPSCKKTISTVGPLLYHDPTIPALYYLNPPTFDQNTDKLDEMLSVISSVEGSNASHYQTRVVSSTDKLLEKIHIQAAGLDDRIVELVKIAYLKHYASELQTQGTIHSILFTPQNKDTAAQIIFILGTDHQTASIDFSMEYYNYFKSIYKEQLEQPADTNFEIIDEKWALKLLKN